MSSKVRKIAGRLGVVAIAGGLVAGKVWLKEADAATPAGDRRIDAAERAAVIDGIVSKLDAYYVFPEKAGPVGTRLRERAANGEFDEDSAIAFAESLTKALRSDSKDGHIEVRHVMTPLAAGAKAGEPPDSEVAAEALHQQRMNYGLAGFSRLRGNIGYVDVRAFGRPVDRAAARYAAVMAMVADTDALIVDLRKCEGGDPDAVMRFASYFFDRPTHLNDVYWRDENRTEARWTDPHVDGAPYGEKRKVYLLTSRETYSGCEDLAYALKHARRATIVGDTTGGGAHAGSPRVVSPHFMVFVPTGRPINPVTGTDWEGVGVAPDLRASAAKAQDVAHVAAMKAIIASETDAEWRAALQRTLSEIE